MNKTNPPGFLSKSPQFQRLYRDIREKPERASAYKETARILCAQDRHRQAARVLRAGLQHLPEDQGLLENLARALQAGGFSRAAVRTWRKVADLFPDSYLAYEKLERLYVRSGQPQKAVKMYSRVGAEEPLQEKSLERIVFVSKEANDIRGALKALKKLVKSYGVTYRRSRDLGRLHFKAGNFKEASRWLKQAFSREEGDLELRITLGLAYVRQKKFLPAEKQFRRILSEKPNSFAGLINLCEMKIQEGELEAARHLWRRIDALYSKNSRALIALGEIELCEGHLSRAEENLRAGIRGTPYYYRWELERGYALLSRVFRRRGEEREADLHGRLADALHSSPDAYQAFIQLAENEIGQHDLDTATRVLAILSRMFPDNTRVIIAQAEIELLKGYPLKAVETLNQCLERTPEKFIRDKIKGFQVQGRAYRSLGDWKEAANSFRQARAVEAQVL